MNKKGSEDFTKLVEYKDEYKHGANRFDAGEFPAFINIPMSKAALTQILDWGVENIQATISILTRRIAEMAIERGITISDPNHDGHMIGLKFVAGKAKEISKAFLEHAIYISFRGTSMRIAPHLYNDLNEVAKLFEFI